jgi:hypothetical protein
MLPVTGPESYRDIFALSIIFGGLGGVVGALLETLTQRHRGWQWPDWAAEMGKLAAIGAAVGLAIMYVVDPTKTTTTTLASGTVVTSVTYDPFKVAPLAVIAGTAGRAVLTAIQARVTGAINEQKVKDTAAAGKQAVKNAQDSAKLALSDVIQDAAKRVAEATTPVVHAAAEALPAGTEKLLRSDLTTTNGVLTLPTGETLTILSPKARLDWQRDLHQTIQEALSEVAQSGASRIDASAAHAVAAIDATARA